MSSSGKTQHFDCCIRRFESCHPSQNRKNSSVRMGSFCFRLLQDENRRFVEAAEKPHQASQTAKSRAPQIILQTARSGQNNAGAEYPATPAKNPVNTGVYGIFTSYLLPLHSYLKSTFLSIFNKYQFRNFTSLFINYSLEILGKSLFFNISKFSNDHIQSHRQIFTIQYLSKATARISPC